MTNAAQQQDINLQTDYRHLAIVLARCAMQT